MALAASACVPVEPVDPLVDADVALGQSYDSEPAFRRKLLEASIVNPDNGYSALRLDRYDEAGWGALPTFNPRARPVVLGDIGLERPEEDLSGWGALDVEGTPWERSALIALGREAFFSYPISSGLLSAALRSPEGPARYGLWVDDAGQVGGLVWSEQARGERGLSATCATCHAAPAPGDPEGVVIAGLNNGRLDLGAITRDSALGSVGPRSAWGPGRVDVTGDDLDNPVAITDLRAIRHQTHLHRAATLRNSLGALAVRVETLLITSLNERQRPPRKLAFALALYLWDLDPGVDTGALDPEGLAIFEARCASCHAPPTFAGPPVPVDLVGTDPTVALSPDRATGSWRVPSLIGVKDRSPLTASGATRTLDDLFDPDREAPGHPFGLDLGEADRASLLELLKSL